MEIKTRNLISAVGQVIVSYFEVYEDNVYDLLDVSNRDKPIEECATVSLWSDGEGNQVLKGLTTFDVDNEGERGLGNVNQKQKLVSFCVERTRIC